jgi:hypothetical protein
VALRILRHEAKAVDDADHAFVLVDHRRCHTRRIFAQGLERLVARRCGS